MIGWIIVRFARNSNWTRRLLPSWMLLLPESWRRYTWTWRYRLIWQRKILIPCVNFLMISIPEHGMRLSVTGSLLMAIRSCKKHCWIWCPVPWLLSGEINSGWWVLLISRQRLLTLPRLRKFACTGWTKAAWSTSMPGIWKRLNNGRERLIWLSWWNKPVSGMATGGRTGFARLLLMNPLSTITKRRLKLLPCCNVV